jgi:hypothetical protein
MIIHTNKPLNMLFNLFSLQRPAGPTTKTAFYWQSGIRDRKNTCAAGQSHNDYLSRWPSRGNGGFGPDHGLLGLGSGRVTDQGDTALSRYRAFGQPDPDDPGGCLQ